MARLLDPNKKDIKERLKKGAITFMAGDRISAP